MTTTVKRTSRTNDCDGREKRDADGKSEKKCDVEPPRQLLQEQGK